MMGKRNEEYRNDPENIGKRKTPEFKENKKKSDLFFDECNK